MQKVSDMILHRLVRRITIEVDERCNHLKEPVVESEIIYETEALKNWKAIRINEWTVNKEF